LWSETMREYIVPDFLIWANVTYKGGNTPKNEMHVETGTITRYTDIT